MIVFWVRYNYDEKNYVKNTRTLFFQINYLDVFFFWICENNLSGIEGKKNTNKTRSQNSKNCTVQYHTQIPYGNNILHDIKKYIK